MNDLDKLKLKKTYWFQKKNNRTTHWDFQTQQNKNGTVALGLGPINIPQLQKRMIPADYWIIHVN
jgi:hypothetical protein